MTRRNFTKAVQVARFKFCKGRCEGTLANGKRCNAMLKPGGFEADHNNPDGLTGEPTFENCKILCLACHATKTPLDIAAIALAKRREAKHIGIKRPPGRGIVSPPPPEKKAPRFNKEPLPWRPLFIKKGSIVE